MISYVYKCIYASMYAYRHLQWELFKVRRLTCAGKVSVELGEGLWVRTKLGVQSSKTGRLGKVKHAF